MARVVHLSAKRNVTTVEDGDELRLPDLNVVEEEHSVLVLPRGGVSGYTLVPKSGQLIDGQAGNKAVTGQAAIVLTVIRTETPTGYYLSWDAAILAANDLSQGVPSGEGGDGVSVPDPAEGEDGDVPTVQDGEYVLAAPAGGGGGSGITLDTTSLAAYLSDASSWHVNIPHFAELNSSQLTIEMWAKIETNEGWNTVIAKDNGAGSLTQLVFSIDNLGKIEFYADREDDGYLEGSTAQDLFDIDTWNHFAVTVDHDTDSVAFYLNGRPVEAEDVTSSPGALYTNSDPLVINHSQYWWGSGSEAFIGDVRIYDSVRTAEEIYSDYHLALSAPFDDSLVGYWQLGEGEGLVAEDELGNNDGAYTADEGDQQWVPSGMRAQSGQPLVSLADGQVMSDNINLGVLANVLTKTEAASTYATSAELTTAVDTLETLIETEIEDAPFAAANPFSSGNPMLTVFRVGQLVDDTPEPIVVGIPATFTNYISTNLPNGHLFQGVASDDSFGFCLGAARITEGASFSILARMILYTLSGDCRFFFGFSDTDPTLDDSALPVGFQGIRYCPKDSDTNFQIIGAAGTAVDTGFAPYGAGSGVSLIGLRRLVSSGLLFYFEGIPSVDSPITSVSNANPPLVIEESTNLAGKLWVMAKRYNNANVQFTCSSLYGELGTNA